MIFLLPPGCSSTSICCWQKIRIWWNHEDTALERNFCKRNGQGMILSPITVFKKVIIRKYLHFPNYLICIFNTELIVTNTENWIKKLKCEPNKYKVNKMQLFVILTPVLEVILHNVFFSVCIKMVLEKVTIISVS